MKVKQTLKSNEVLSKLVIEARPTLKFSKQYTMCMCHLTCVLPKPSAEHMKPTFPDAVEPLEHKLCNIVMVWFVLSKLCYCFQI